MNKTENDEILMFYNHDKAASWYVQNLHRTYVTKANYIITAP